MFSMTSSLNDCNAALNLDSWRTGKGRSRLVSQYALLWLGRSYKRELTTLAGGCRCLT